VLFEVIPTILTEPSFVWVASGVIDLGIDFASSGMRVRPQVKLTTLCRLNFSKGKCIFVSYISESENQVSKVSDSMLFKKGRG
jgi:hypothetical protein